MTIGDSLKLGRSLSVNSSQLNQGFERLSSGKRINKAADDAAGLAIVAALEADVRTTLQGSRNTGDGVSIASIADGALGQISDISTRQAELATQSANGTLSDEQRQSLNSEYQQLEQEKSRILQTTEFNGTSVFSGSTLQVGSDGSTNSQINLPSVSTDSVLSAQDISSQAGARAALDAVESTINNVSQVRGQIGAVVSRLNTADENSKSRAVESEAAASRIRDADIADESAKLTAASIRQQSSVALSAQAGKLNADTVLKLLS